MGETLHVLLQFVGVTLMALITVSTARIVIDMCGPEGVEGVRKMRERLERRDPKP